MPDPGPVFALSDPEPWKALRRPSVERVLPGMGTLWVHSYTGAGWDSIRLVACTMADVRLDKDPGRQALAYAQVIHVCRTEPGGKQRTFKVESGCEKQAFAHMAATLPWRWVETVCEESDALAMAGYIPPKGDGKKREPDHAAIHNLREALADQSLYAALNLAHIKLYARPLAQSDDQIGEVLTMIAMNDEFMAGLVGAFGALGI